MEENEDFQTAVEIFEKELIKSIEPSKKRNIDEIIRPIIKKKRISAKSGRSIAPIIKDEWLSYEHFLDFCRHRRSREARIVVKRAEGENNLSGHVKHFFFGSAFFLIENSDSISLIPDNLGAMENVLWQEQPWINSWFKFLLIHGDEVLVNLGFSFRTLKVYLPTRLGGTTTSGGAGTGTFKRVLPLVKQMILVEIVINKR